MGGQSSQPHWSVSEPRNLKLNGSLKREERAVSIFLPSAFFYYKFIVGGNMNKNENATGAECVFVCVSVRLLIMHAAYAARSRCVCIRKTAATGCLCNPTREEEK